MTLSHKTYVRVMRALEYAHYLAWTDETERLRYPFDFRTAVNVLLQDVAEAMLSHPTTELSPKGKRIAKIWPIVFEARARTREDWELAGLFIEAQSILEKTEEEMG